MSSVLQEWVSKMPWKCQSILISGLRGTDDGAWPETKAVSRWLRALAQHNADPSKGYMQTDVLPSPLDLCAELEYRTCHFVHHFADALRTVAIFHPDARVQMRTAEYHHRIAEELFHFQTESDEAFLLRHRDVVPHA